MHHCCVYHCLQDHFGVVKAFLDAGLLPRVISGTSAGGLVASLVCTHTDAELKQLLVSELAHRITACEEPFGVWIRRFWKTGARFDSVTWARKVWLIDRTTLCFGCLLTTTVLLLHSRLYDFSGSIYQDRPYSQHFCDTRRQTFVRFISIHHRPKC